MHNFVVIASAVKFFENLQEEEEGVEKSRREKTLMEIKRRGIRGFPPTFMNFIEVIAVDGDTSRIKIDLSPYMLAMTLKAAPAGDPYMISSSVEPFEDTSEGPHNISRYAFLESAVGEIWKREQGKHP